jgi:hypothetical protein
MVVVSLDETRKAESNLVREESVTVATSAVSILVRVLILMGTPASATVVDSGAVTLKADNILMRFSPTIVVSLSLLMAESKRVSAKSAMLITSGPVSLSNSLQPETFSALVIVSVKGNLNADNILVLVPAVIVTVSVPGTLMVDNRRVSEKSLTPVVSLAVFAKPLRCISDASTTVMLSVVGTRKADSILVGVPPMVRVSEEGVLVADSILTNDESVTVVVSVDGTPDFAFDTVRDASAIVIVSELGALAADNILTREESEKVLLSVDGIRAADFILVRAASDIVVESLVVPV